MFLAVLLFGNFFLETTILSLDLRECPDETWCLNYFFDYCLRSINKTIYILLTWLGRNWWEYLICYFIKWQGKGFRFLHFKLMLFFCLNDPSKLILPIADNLNTVLHTLHLALAVSHLTSLSQISGSGSSSHFFTKKVCLLLFFFWYLLNELLSVFIYFFIKTKKNLNWKIHHTMGLNDGNNKELYFTYMLHISHELAWRR